MSPSISPSECTLRLLALSMLKGVGPSTLRKVVRIPRYETKPVEDLASTLPAIKRAISVPEAWDKAIEGAREQAMLAGRHEASIISIADPLYPALLASTSDDPCILYVKGCLQAEGVGTAVAVIGTRQPTKHGRIITERICSYLVANKISVVSGLALGCDAIAHQATLDAGGHTIGVLAHGLETISPARNRKLADDILESGGALLSEFPFGTRPLPQLFVQRDRTQAGLSVGVVMIQSDIQGGSLHASRAAISYGRWLAVPYPTIQDKDAGESKIQANLLLSDGGPAAQADLLRCPIGMLRNVLVLRGRDDYVRLVDGEVNRHALPEQGGLL